LLLPSLCKFAPGLGELALGQREFIGQLPDPVFRRGMILGGRSCHDYTRFPYNLPVGSGPFLDANKSLRARGMLRDAWVRWNVQSHGIVPWILAELRPCTQFQSAWTASPLDFGEGEVPR